MVLFVTENGSAYGVIKTEPVSAELNGAIVVEKPQLKKKSNSYSYIM